MPALGAHGNRQFWTENRCMTRPAQLAVVTRLDLVPGHGPSGGLHGAGSSCQGAPDHTAKLQLWLTGLLWDASGCRFSGSMGLGCIRSFSARHNICRCRVLVHCFCATKTLRRKDESFSRGASLWFILPASLQSKPNVAIKAFLSPC